METIPTSARAAQEAHLRLLKSINAYQETLVSWIDEEGHLLIDTYAQFLATRS
jgi:uncharacterized membrane-anchored protein